MSLPKFGPTGQTVYERSYRRVKPNGDLETWFDTVERVVDGNLALVPAEHIEPGEREALISMMRDFKVLPGGRHLWMSGVPGRQFIFNCHHAGWGEHPSEHFRFVFDQLMQGGGVGANYSTRYLDKYAEIPHEVDLHIVCDPSHPDYHEFAQDVSSTYSYEWGGAERFEDSREGWADALQRLLYAFWNGETELVIDVSLMRPRGSKIKTFGGTASGPGPLVEALLDISTLLNKRVGKKLTSMDAMMIDHYLANCVVSGNVRRSARMSIKHWADADIFDFISCKEDKKAHWSTNISVEIDDEFFKQLKSRGANHAKAVYAAAVAGMTTNGEPGFYNRTLAQVGELGEVASTNPCGEIPLEEWENCNIGHVNLDAFHHDHEGAKKAHRYMARYLVRATFADIPNERQQAVVAKNRRIGVGHFGYQGYVVKQGIRYSDSHRSPIIRQHLSEYRNVVRAAANDYAFALRIPAPIKVTTVAPTGSIAKMPGTTEGIHPIYGRHFIRRIRFAADDPILAKHAAKGLTIVDDIYAPNTKVVEFVTKDLLMQQVEDLGLDADYLIESADEIDLGDMLAIQAFYQEVYADNAVSFTVNLSPGRYTAKEVGNTLKHYLPRLKGTTIMVDESRELAPYERISREQYDAATTKTFVADGVDEACANGACPVR